MHYADWLNNWEQQWGAECSSMMFELPHFAVELLVVLPCVQVCDCIVTAPLCLISLCDLYDRVACFDAVHFGA